VFRPADTIETAESWQLALENKDGPSILALTRQKLPTVRKKFTSKNLTKLGAYNLKNNSKNPQVSIYASGSEIEVASELMMILEKKKITARIISVPCFELFKSQNTQYKKSIFGNSKVNISIEAGSCMGWNEVCPKQLINVSLEEFGASAPYKKLYDFYGFAASKIFKKIIKKL
jgi:transketolase